MAQTLIIYRQIQSLTEENMMIPEKVKNRENVMLGTKEGDVGSKTTCRLSRKGQGAFFLMIPGFSYGLSLFQKFIMRAANPNNSCSSQLATKGNEGDVGSKTT